MSEEKQILKVSSNGMEFYCERRGTKGPKIVFIPAGSNDCEQYDRLAVRLSDEFQTLTFDMRGGMRSMDPEPRHATPSLLAADVAGIMQALDFYPATVFGCSSGGQAALALGKQYPQLVNGLIIHEAALQNDTPLPGAGFTWFQNVMSFAPLVGGGINPISIVFNGNWEALQSLGQETNDRLNANNIYWGEWYVGTADSDT